VRIKEIIGWSKPSCCYLLASGERENYASRRLTHHATNTISPSAQCQEANSLRNSLRATPCLKVLCLNGRGCGDVRTSR
jgi:hypothetical protein